MKELTINLTDEQAKFLREFAEKQKPGAKDNASTAHAFHVVENKEFDFIPYSDDLNGFFEDLPLTFTTDCDYDRWWDDETEMISDWYEDRGEDCPIEIKPFSELRYNYFKGLLEEEELITEWSEYFEAYGVKLHAMAWRKTRWEKVAFFFIRDEAKRYMKYQSHNLNEPRVYTYSCGYANDGDFVPFRDLLMSMGAKLVEKVNA
ncbi:hypothetical protein [Oceanobacillus salinisoli]|uniref:hypothetical protein n=1 Tax=Oceanobacillus salinisoli TaxID=2678611 RepID=UPI0012E31FBD|nr:hypothetical protein [Oceanobacillus salinisoli]